MATDERLERNKAFVMAFYDLMFNECQPAEAMERFAGDVYIQHNPHVGDANHDYHDTEAFRAALGA
jgi:predicted SnoaL-like aldol condensation-catalyzing enzyme